MRPISSSLALLAVVGCSAGPMAPAAPPPPDPQLARCAQDFGDPSRSRYVLPFPAGKTYRMFQGNCPSNPAWGHYGALAYDFDMPIGDTVIASRAGVVIWSVERWPNGTRDCTGRDNGVAIQHDDGTIMQYAHFTTNGSFVEVGEVVVSGQPIGRSGDSGCSSGPHLHVWLLKDGTSWGKDNTMPLNYRNADGPVDARGALVEGQSYSARPT